LAAIEAGDLVETASFDAKAALPAKGKSKDLAIDVAAMANDGGTLLYGVGEDENDRPTIPQPFRLAGARERVDQIVRTSISEPPDIQVRELPTDEDASLGYLVIAVPPSPRAPHMVTVGKEYRYYGRGDTDNVLLTEGEVARLYERRQRWEVDRDAMLDEAIFSAPIEPHEDFAYLHVVARPWCQTKTCSIGQARASRRRSSWVVESLPPQARWRSLPATRPTSTEATTTSGGPPIDTRSPPHLRTSGGWLDR
jgi:hypothetical protein